MTELKENEVYRLTIWEECHGLLALYIGKNEEIHSFGYRNPKGEARLLTIPFKDIITISERQITARRSESNARGSKKLDMMLEGAEI